ncbi:MAG: sensor histidine kinase [Comamonas sp.]
MPATPSRPGLRSWLRAWLGLKASLLLALVPCVGVVLVVDNGVDFRGMARQIQQAYDQSLLEPAQALADAVSATSDGVHMEMPFAVNSMFAATSSAYKQLAVRVSWRDGAEGAPTHGTHGTHGERGADGLYHRQLLGDAALPGPPRPAVQQPVFYDAQFQGRPVRIAAIERQMHAGGTDYLVQVLAAESTGAREQSLQVMWQQTVLRDVWQLAVVALLVWLSVSWTLRPLNRLREGLRQRHGQPLATPLESQGVPHEVRPLVDLINQHIGARQAAVEAQARFLADASHQLRMPLAIMFAQARYALREHDPVRTRETLEAILGQLGHSRRLAEQLLSLAHATQAAPGEGARRVDLNAIARDVVLQYLAMAHDKNIDLGWQDARGEEVVEQWVEGSGETAAPVVPVLASGVEIREILANLVHNAIGYTPCAGHITLAVHAAGAAAGVDAGAPGPGRWVRAEVIDSGPGIAPERREAAFARFQREAAAEVADAATARGAGLGLSIARAYARRNGGEVVLHDAQPEARALGRAPGLRAVLWLPAAA